MNRILPLSLLAATLQLAAPAQSRTPIPHPSFEVLTQRMDVDVDGAPDAYGPPGKAALDIPKDAHYRGFRFAPIVGYLLDRHHHPVIQGPHDPFPGYYVSQTAFTDPNNDNERDPRGYLDARHINYVVLGDYARSHGTHLGDFVAVYSKRTHRAVFAIVGDSGNPSGDEGSLHLLRDLGYPFTDGISDSVTHPEIVIRFYPGSNPRQQFFFTQAALNRAAEKLGLSRDFPASSPRP